jgi:hypothetical protein
VVPGMTAKPFSTPGRRSVGKDVRCDERCGHRRAGI